MGIEIERKFLVDHEKWNQLVKPAGIRYRQGYVLSDSQRTIRIRVAGQQGFITFKGATTGISRKEYEYKIPVDDGNELLDSFALSEVEKVRYRINYAGKLWEVDEFFGDNEGLIMAEIELQHENEQFALPDWVTLEVSSDERYFNSFLSTNPFKNWGHR
jgi:CYTH domain-containing protein